MENAVPDLNRRLYREWKDLIANPIEGVGIIINEQDITDFQAIIDGPVGSPYDKGKYRVRLVIPERYPIDPPKAYFGTKILHPNIAPMSGEVCVNTLKKDWKSNLGLKHILITIICLLVYPNPESALNEEAGKLILEDYDEYVSQAKLINDVHACKHLRKQSEDFNMPSVSKKLCSNETYQSVNQSGAVEMNQQTLKVNQRNVSISRKALKRL